MRFTGWVAAAAAAAAAFAACTDPPTAPDAEPAAAVAPASPTTQAVTPQAVAIKTVPASENNGLKVEILFDEWGEGACHTQDGTRTFRLTNEYGPLRYDRLGCFTDTESTCATQKTPTGKPFFSTTCPVGANGVWGVPPGQSCEYSVTVQLPDGRNVCTLQCDNSLGPGGIGESATVLADSWHVPEKQCKTCIENPTETVKCTDWEEGDCEATRTCTKTIDYKCKPDPPPVTWPETRTGEWKGQFCTTYLSNSGTYYTTDDGARWLEGLNLSSGNQNTCWNHAIDGSELCLKWRSETIGCKTAACGDTGVSSSWHGKVKFRCRCVMPR